MASRLRAPTLGLAGLSMCLCLAIIGTAGRSLYVFNHEQSTNVWLLPIWPAHFDIRELKAIIGTAAGIFVLNAILAAVLFTSNLPANGIAVVSSLLSTLVGIVAIAFPQVLDQHAPHKDTLKTYTCRWADHAEILRGYGPPKQFDGLCGKTRFAYWATIPLFIIQVLLLVLAISALFGRSKTPSRGGHEDLEKSGHQLRNVPSSRGNVSFDTKMEGSPISHQGSQRYLNQSYQQQGRY